MLRLDLRSALVVVAVAAYLTAAATPCPPAARPEPAPSASASDANSGHHPIVAADAGGKHHHGPPVGDPDRAFVAPCPCGCDKHAPGDTSSRQLGPAVVLAPTECTAPGYAGGFAHRDPRPPVAPLNLPDPVPLAA